MAQEAVASFGVLEAAVSGGGGRGGGDGGAVASDTADATPPPPPPPHPLRRYSFPADVWSAGVVCFAMLSGEMPFDAAASFRSVSYAIQNLDFDFDSEVGG